jgi:hypothetical protein
MTFFALHNSSGRGENEDWWCEIIAKCEMVASAEAKSHPCFLKPELCHYPTEGLWLSFPAVCDGGGFFNPKMP